MDNVSYGKGILCLVLAGVLLLIRIVEPIPLTPLLVGVAVFVALGSLFLWQDWRERRKARDESSL